MYETCNAVYNLYVTQNESQLYITILCLFTSGMNSPVLLFPVLMINNTVTLLSQGPISGTIFDEQF